MQPNPLNQPQHFPVGPQGSRAATFAAAFSDLVRSGAVILFQLLIGLTVLSVFVVGAYALWFGVSTVLRALGAY